MSTPMNPYSNLCTTRLHLTRIGYLIGICISASAFAQTSPVTASPTAKEVAGVVADKVVTTGVEELTKTTKSFREKNTQVVQNTLEETKSKSPKQNPVKAINRGTVLSDNDVKDKTAAPKNLKLKSPGKNMPIQDIAAPANNPVDLPTPLAPPETTIPATIPANASATTTVSGLPTETPISNINVDKSDSSSITNPAVGTEENQDITFTGDQLNVGKSKNTINKVYQYQIGGSNASARKVSVETDDGSTITETREPLQVVTDITVKSAVGSEYQMSRPIDHMNTPRGNQGNNAVQRVPSLGISW